MHKAISEKEKTVAVLWGKNKMTLADVERKLKTKSPKVYITLCRALKSIHYKRYENKTKTSTTR